MLGRLKRRQLRRGIGERRNINGKDLEMKNLCFYHNADLDGLCSAAIVKKFVPDTDFYGINYGDEFPWDLVKNYKNIIMVDWTLQPYEKLLDFANFHDLTVIDHHKSVLEEVKKHGERNFMGILNSSRAACELCWKYFTTTKIPMAVELLSKYDIWDLTDPCVVPFQYGMRNEIETYDDPRWNLFLYDKSDSIWLRSQEKAVDEVIKNGATILEYQQKMDNKYVSLYAHEVKFEGYNCWAVNKAQCNSKLFLSLPERDIHISYIHTPNKPLNWTISLYSITIDCSEIAKRYGGGGHFGAAGFQCNELPFKIQNS